MELNIRNELIKRIFMTSNYMYLYEISAGNGITSILIPERDINGRGELDAEKPIPKSP